MRVIEEFPTRIMIVDDKESVRDSLRGVVSLESNLYQVLTAASGFEALVLLEGQKIDIVLCDFVLTPEMNGVAVTRTVCERYPDTRVVVFTGKELPQNTKLEVLQAGAFSYLSKPISYDELLHGISSINSIRRTEFLGRCFKILSHIAFGLQETFNLDLLAQRIVEGAHELGYDRARLYLFDEKREVLICRAAYGMPDEFVGYQIPLNAGPVIRVIFDHDRPTVLGDEDIAEHFGKRCGEPWLDDIALRGVPWIDCPLVVGNRRIGTLAIDHHDSPERQYTHADIQIISVFAGLAAHSLNNARLYQQEALARQQEALARASLDSILREAPDAIVTTDLSGVINQVSPSTERVLGLPPERLLGQLAANLYTDETGSREFGKRIAHELMRELREKGTVSNRKVFLLAGGSPRAFFVSINLLHGSQGEEVGTLGFLKDLMSIEEQSRYRDLLEGFGNGMVLLGRMGVIEYCNSKAERLLWRPRAEIQGSQLLDFISKEYREELHSCIETALKDGVERSLDLDILRPDGVPTPVKILLSPCRSEESIKGVAVVLYGADELLALSQAGRLMVLGQMVAAVAHEINNPLNNILPAVRDLGSLNNMKGVLSDRHRFYMDTIERNGLRIQKIVRQLREFARPREFVRMPLSLNDIARDSLSFIETSFCNRNIRIDLRLAPDLPKVFGEATGLQQVIINLLMNADEAMADQVEEKVIWIETRYEPSHRVILTVCDSGPGVPLEFRDLLFDPYFTTKGPSKGTGLGLSISKNIMDLHEGTVELIEHSGHSGACFKLEMKSVE